MKKSLRYGLFWAYYDKGVSGIHSIGTQKRVSVEKQTDQSESVAGRSWTICALVGCRRVSPVNIGGNTCNDGKDLPLH